MRPIQLLLGFLCAGCLQHDARYCAHDDDCGGSPYPYCDVGKRECETTPPDGLPPDLQVGDQGPDDLFDLTLDHRDASLDLREPDLMPACTSATDCRTTTAPICDPVDQVCRPCSGSADDAQCAAHGAPRCNPLSHSCVACLTGGDCASPFSPVCDRDSCRACRSNAECPPLATGAGWPATGVCRGDGSCAALADAALVDNTTACTAAASPFCELADAVTSSGKSILVIRGSGTVYQKAVTIPSTSGTLFILGPSASPSAQISQNGQAALTVATTGSATASVVADGLDLIGSAGATKKDAVDCSQLGGATTLTLRHCLIHDSGALGVNSTGCTLILDGNLIGPANTGGGISITTTAASTYTVTNNIVQSNTTGAGVSLLGLSAGVFAFNTVANNNVSAGTSGVACAGANKPIADSIVWDNNHTQIDAACAPATNVVTGTGSGAGAPSFAADFHLTASAGSTACCVDKVAAPGTPNSDHDVDFTARPKGAAWDVGAHELQ